ncbi:MAG: hypothetical protein IID61_09905, partial [SAR324 cluster bacterium]|nr:hypothetical protein [SAR324 cluster bacterium]
MVGYDEIVLLAARRFGIGKIKGDISNIDTELLDDFVIIASSGDFMYQAYDFNEATPAAGTVSYIHDVFEGTNTVMVVPEDVD